MSKWIFIIYILKASFYIYLTYKFVWKEKRLLSSFHHLYIKKDTKVMEMKLLLIIWKMIDLNSYYFQQNKNYYKTIYIYIIDYKKKFG